MKQRKPRIGVLAVGRSTFDVEFAQSVFEQAWQALQRLDAALVGEPRIHYEADAALAAFATLQASDIDLLLVVQVTFTDAAVVTAIGLGSLFAINLLQTCSLLLVPVSQRAFRRVNRWCANVWWGACVVAAERCNGTRLVVTGAAVPLEENVLVVVNHQGIGICFPTARVYQPLGG